MNEGINWVVMYYIILFCNSLYNIDEQFSKKGGGDGMIQWHGKANPKGSAKRKRLQGLTGQLYMILHYFEIHDIIKTAFQNSPFTSSNHKA